MKTLALYFLIALLIPSLNSCGQKKEAQSKTGKVQIQT